MDFERLNALVDSGEVDTVVTAFADHFGRLMGKRITGHFFVDEVARGGMHTCDYLLACDVEMEPVPGFAFTSWADGYGDVHGVPDLSTLRLLPWLDKTAFVLCDLFRAHQPVRISPRQILRAQLERARSAGIVPKGGSELEFYIFKDSYEGARDKKFHELEPYGWYIEDYHILQSTKEEWLVRAIRNSMDAADVPVEFSKGEWGPGQQEINLRYAEFLEMADRHTIYKHGVKEIAALNKVAITFMAKWDEKYAGSSCHVHASLWDVDGGSSLCADPSGAYGMSTMFRHWLAGQLKYARELSLFFAPFVNSYKRFQSSSFAPTRVAWGHDNRTVGFRVLGEGASLRAENRIPGADVNPYLVFAATLAAGLAGIEEELELPPPFEGDAYQAGELDSVPTTIEEAIALADGSTLARKALGDDVVDHYIHVARAELASFAKVVTCWERERHFERT
jgi:glutamine synthetase